VSAIYKAIHISTDSVLMAYPAIETAAIAIVNGLKAAEISRAHLSFHSGEIITVSVSLE